MTEGDDRKDVDDIENELDRMKEKLDELIGETQNLKTTEEEDTEEE